MTQNLKPCPFCGGEAEIRTYGSKGTGLKYIRCTDCHAATASYLTKKEVLAAWNTRVAPQWLPIESAPRDKTVLLTNGDFVATGRWHDGGNRHPFEKWDGTSMGAHLPWCNYWASADGVVPFSKNQPTHWMPLPAPPQHEPEKEKV